MAEIACKPQDGETKSDIPSRSVDDHETDATEASSSDDSREKEKGPVPTDYVENYDEELKIKASELVETQPERQTRSSSITQFLCCVNDEEFSKYSVSDSHQLPSACKACVALWTEKTRQRFERNIENLLSTVDSRNDCRRYSLEDDARSCSSSWSRNFEDRYRVMMNKGLIILREEVEKDEAVRDAESESTETNSPRHHRSLLGFPRSKTTRLRWMRRKMSPQEENDSERSVRKSQSFDDHVLRSNKLTKTHAQPWLVLSTTDCVQSSEKKQKYSSLSHAFQHACECGSGDKMYAEDTGMHYGDRSLLESDDEDLGYDSDPEIQAGHFGAGILAPINSCDDSEGEGNETTHSVKPGKNDSDKENRDSVDFSDIDESSQLMEEILYGSMTLIWHPSKSAETLKIRSPTCVKAWIELGCRVKGQVIQPKLVWRNAYQQQRRDVGKSNKCSIASSTETLESVDILDIARILTSQDIDREKFPLAKNTKSFTIVTTENSIFLFEVADAGERNRIVSGLKLLVARLASLIIVGDKKLFDDFFYPTTSSDFQKKFCGEDSVIYVDN